MAEIDPEKCNFRQFSELQKPRDLDFDFRSSQGHMSMYNTYRTISLPDHVTVASSNTEIGLWSFEVPVVSTFREV